MAGNSLLAPTAGADGGARGLRALAPALWQVRWPPKFKPEMPPCFDGAADPSAFLLAYEEAVLEARGDDKIIANWLPMALVGEPRAWLLNLPESTVASWEELRGLFTVRYAVPAHHAVAALLGGSQAPPSDRHAKPFLHQIGILTIKGDAKEALTALKLTHKAAAAAQPAGAGAPEAKGSAPAKKKELFTQDKAETKQVSVDEDGASGATFTIGHHPELPAPRLRLPRSAPASRRLLRRAPARPWAHTGILRRVPACSASPGRPAPRRRIQVLPASAGHSCARATRLASAPPELLASTSPSPPPSRSASASHRLQPPARPRHELSLPSQAPLGPPSSFARAGLPPSTQPGPAGSAPPGFGSPRADSPPCPPAGSRGPASPCLGRLAPLAGVRLIAPPRSRVPHARAGSPRSSPAGSRHSAGPPPAGSSAPGRLPAPAHPAACRLRASLPAPPNSYDRLRR
nr:formin-like protein 5 [Aegilops tauschii subsp. strangulata]